MKKKITVILFTIALLAGCEAVPATIQNDTPDIDAIVQRSVEKRFRTAVRGEHRTEGFGTGAGHQLDELRGP